MQNEEDNFARTTTADLRSVAEDMLRMGRHWARAAQGWLERSGQAAGHAGDAAARQWTRTRSDRDLQSDYSGGGYDQVDAQHAAERYRRTAAGYETGGAQGGYQGTRSYQGVGPRNYTRSDERIREDLNERLTEAYDLDASDITVEVEDGVATLGGTVAQRWMKHRAEDLADGCTGVRDVRNRIQVGAASGTTSGTTSNAGSSKVSSKTSSGTHAGPTGRAGSTGKEIP